MSNRYTGARCPVCSRKFGERDDVVVCPICGTPHHRACYLEHGQCFHTDWHDEGKSWPGTTEQESSGQESGAERDQLRCPRCGTQNPSSSLFCEVCGTQLVPLNPDSPKPADLPEDEGNPFQNVRFMPYNPFVNPFGGLDPEETIEDIPVRDLAIYLGQNTHYFLPLFKHMSQPENRTSWNWGAFLFPQFYGFYRKMYLPSLFAFLILALLEIPGVLIMLHEFPAITSIQTLSVNWATLTSLQWVFSLLGWGVRAFFAAFANKLYRDHTLKRVRAIREQYADAPDYQEQLAAAGGVSLLPVVLFAAILFVVVFLCLAWLVMPLQ